MSGPAVDHVVCAVCTSRCRLIDSVAMESVRNKHGEPTYVFACDDCFDKLFRAPLRDALAGADEAISFLLEGLRETKDPEKRAHFFSAAFSLACDKAGVNINRRQLAAPLN